jgi:hypothetical protein
MDAILVTTEDDGDGHYATATALDDGVLSAALDRINRNRSFFYLPAAFLSVMVPPSPQQAGRTLGTLTLFRGGRVQWEEGDVGSLAQDWRIPHVYSDTEGALRLWRVLLGGDVDAVRRREWIAAQTKLCPICGFDLSGLRWPARGGGDASTEPPLDLPTYETCGGCRTTFGVDWIGATYGEMRQRWLEKACPWWASSDVPAEVRSDPLALQAFERLSRDLMRTPTDYPLSAARE